MTQAFRNIAGAVGAAAVLALVNRSRQRVGANCHRLLHWSDMQQPDPPTCQESGGIPLPSTCKNANDPRCGSCSDIPEATPRGLCNAYCDRLNCPAATRGSACDQLRKNWLRATGSTAFPCDVPDRPACCQCPGAGPTCSSAKRCLKAQCQIIDQCVDGKCPEPQCCECANQDPSACYDEVIPGVCRRHGCTPEADAVCTDRGLCEKCPCGADCTDAAGKVGQCVNVPGAIECVCQTPPPWIPA